MDKIKQVIRYGVTTELGERAIRRALEVSPALWSMCMLTSAV